MTPDEKRNRSYLDYNNNNMDQLFGICSAFLASSLYHQLVLFFVKLRRHPW